MLANDSDKLSHALYDIRAFGHDRQAEGHGHGFGFLYSKRTDFTALPFSLHLSSHRADNASCSAALETVQGQWSEGRYTQNLSLCCLQSSLMLTPTRRYMIRMVMTDPFGTDALQCPVQLDSEIVVMDVRWVRVSMSDPWDWSLA